MSTVATAIATPSVGDRVDVKVTLLGTPIWLEVIVVQVDDEGDRGVRIICRPEGAQATFARYEWRVIETHTGQHLQGCAACYAAVGA